MSSDHASSMLSFSEFGFNTPILRALKEAGYENPTPIQQEIIPHILKGSDVVGQAQTGTGKTAAFALPLLDNLQLSRNGSPQLLVLAPTRELAIQVAESISGYGKHLQNLRVVPIFGGQDYSIQLKQLKKGVQVVVGTPGRIMDHIRRGTLKPESIHSLVLDEADEMLRMGFLDDVEWIMQQLSGRKQTLLFSATMPPNIRKIAQKYLNKPVEISINTKKLIATTVNQRCLITAGGFAKKVDALETILEAENFDGMLIFVRTKLQTVELSDKISTLGYSVAPLNGDIQQSQRQRTVEQLKSKKIDILVATDVAARGLDVERISHVVNFDIPFDTESYIHRIGRTGRAGRSGEAILFVNPRERAMLRAIERTTRQKIRTMVLPSVSDINKKRIERFKEKISATLIQDTSFYEKLVEEYLHENPVSPTQLAAALAQLSQGSKPLLLAEPVLQRRTTAEKNQRPKESRKKTKTARTAAVQLPPEEGMERFRIAVGDKHGVKPSNIVGAIANEADISSKHIGRISIYDNYSTVDLPYGMPEDTMQLLQRVRVGSRPFKMQRVEERQASNSKPADRQKPNKKRTGPGRKGKNKILMASPVQ